MPAPADRRSETGRGPGTAAAATSPAVTSTSTPTPVPDPVDEGPAPGTPVAAGSLKGKAVRGGVWTIFGFGGGQGLRLFSNILLAQVLLKEDFGLMGMVSVVMAGLLMFSDIGIGPAVIQNKRTDPAFLNTAWTIQVARGLALWFVALAMSFPAAAFFDAPELRWVLPVAAGTAVIQGFRSTNWFTANRNLSVRGMMLIDLGTSAVQAAVMIGWAYGIDPSVWALVAGGLVSTAFSVTLSHCLPGIRNRLAFERGAAGELVRFGRWLFLSTIVTFFAMHLDKLFLGAFLTTGAFGVYYIGQQLANLGPTLASRIAQLVGFPALSEVHRDRPERFDQAFFRLRRVSILPMVTVLAALVLLGPSLFYLLYPVPLWGAGWIVQVLAVAGMTSLVGVSYGNAYMAKGSTASNMATVTAQVLITAAAVSLGYFLGGETGFLLALGVAQLLKHPVDAYLADRLGCWQPRFDLPVFAGSVLLALAALWGSQFLAPPSIQLGKQVRVQAVEAKAAVKRALGFADADGDADGATLTAPDTPITPAAR